MQLCPCFTPSSHNSAQHARLAPSICLSGWKQLQEINQLYSRGLLELIGSCALPAFHADSVSKVSNLHIAHWHWPVLSHSLRLSTTSTVPTPLGTGYTDLSDAKCIVITRPINCWNAWLQTLAACICLWQGWTKMQVNMRCGADLNSQWRAELLGDTSYF